ncbi:MAG: MBL fold metallo-hydrolase [Oceanospirillaceae bacterium]|uniref:MBL fold metallo-hydrolase n=1 Tax=unclassified Thalassolituus TaxID=2624967 RepID=UPI000C65863B|nr:MULTISPECIES: MBL fold metallo-hydrolase [unclassified Thalassolituus]MAS23918.1 MBL fold metallo-hydrolase [Oceanospirillaceae bacterium]MAX97888.1 MBL fold metallo-hydrolase [Oceanospirillaceae bacterium]MBL36335.1 MBL fold metallo-hydrolase [Oceanospirillaceae bacterium]|tara:strand:+ start:1356 stop:2114 length:759 start_codon:yes stop_codon:yes gene_type:complete
MNDGKNIGRKLPVNHSWYSTQKVDHDITLISEMAIDPFYRCNIWHIRGRDSDLLVDSGSGLYSLRQSVAVLAERSVTAVASHAHFDHIGCHHEFDHCLAHPAELAVLTAPDGRETLADQYATAEMFSGAVPEIFDSRGYRVEPVDENKVKPLVEGTRLDTGDRSFEVLHLPGHSPGSVALWDERHGVLFSGDAIYDGPLLADNHHSDMGDYIATMKRLLELPVNQVHGGHFPSFGRKTCQQLIRAFLDTYDQ